MTFSLSAQRQLIVGRNSTLCASGQGTLKGTLPMRRRCDCSTRKFVNLSPQRWEKLREVRNEVDVAVERLLKKDENVFYRRHLGGTWFVTVRSGIWCVDIRKHFNSPSSPTSTDDVDDDILVIVDIVGACW